MSFNTDDTIELQKKHDLCRELESKLFALTGEYDLDIIFTALQSLMTFLMSTVCPGCRKRLARTLKARIPVMLAEANEFAAGEAALGEAAPVHDHRH
jgi:hypothetical protein